MPNNMSSHDKAYHRVPLEIWHEIFSHAYDHPELSVASWDKLKDQTILKETPGKWCPADPITFDILANHDTLWPGSAYNFWQWLMPRTTLRIELPTDSHGYSDFEGNPRHMMQEARRCVRYLERLEKVHGIPIGSIDGVFDATTFEQEDMGIVSQLYRCDSGDYFHKMRPATWFMSAAMKTFQGRLKRFRVVIGACKGDVMETSKYCRWVRPNAAVPLSWQGTLGNDRHSSINDFPMVYFSMADVMAEMKEARTEFKVILRGIDGSRRSTVEHEWYPGSRSANKNIDLVGLWTSDQELCDRDITDLWEGEAVEDARSIAAMGDSIGRRRRIDACASYWGPRFDCVDIGHILFMKVLAKHRAARGEKYDPTVYNPDDSDSDGYDSHEDDSDQDDSEEADHHSPDEANPDEVTPDEDDSKEAASDEQQF